MVAAGSALLLSSACAYEGLGVDRYAAFAVRGDGTVAAAPAASPALTYNPPLAPVGAHMKATLVPSGGSTVADLSVSGLVPNRGYSVVAHVNTCGGVAGGEGPHFQNRIDPAAKPLVPSTNPEYANPTNEIWLDVRTDSTGSGTSHTTVPFVFTDRGPNSLVVHDQQQTSPGTIKAADTDDRVACLSLTATPYGAS